MKDLASSVFRHVRWLASRMGSSRRQKTLNALAIGFIAVGIPWLIETRFLSAFILIPLACLSVFLVADLIVDSFSSYPDDNDPGKAIACVLVGWTFGLTILFTGLVVLNAMNWSAGLLLPRLEILADALWLSMGACVLVAGSTWRVVRRLSSSTTRLTMKFGIVAVTVLCIHGCNTWQIEGTFALTTRTITWLSGFAGVAMFAAGVALLALPIAPKQSTSQ